MIIFLYGPDTYRAKQKLNEIIEQYKKVHKSGLNLVSIDAKENQFSDLMNSFKIVSMFAEKKLVVLNNLFSASGWHEDFLKNFGKLQDTKDLIVVFQPGDADKRTKLFLALNKKAKSQEFALLSGLALKKWTQKEFENLGLKIDADAENFLLASVSGDLWGLKNEINKMSNFKPKSTIKRQDVELMVRPRIETDIFKTIDALASKNKKQALNLLYKHVESGDNILYLVSMIAYQFRSLLIIKDMIDKGVPYGLMAKKSGLHPFVIKKNYYLCNQFSLPKLKEIYYKIFQADFDIKTGKLDAELALNMLVSEV